jgi:membrane fusion protein (multidrug efflux system)
MQESSNTKQGLSDRKKKAIIWMCISVCVLSVALFLYGKRYFVWTNDAFVEAYGIELSTNVTEQITELFVDEGDFVKKGQLLAVLYNNVPLAEKKEALARIAAYEQQVNVSEASYLKIRNDYERALKAFKDQIISAQEFDHNQKDFEGAEAGLDFAYANLELAKKQLAVVEAKLLHYELRAPQDGIIAKRWVWFGDVIQPGQSLYTIYNLDEVWILANIKEKQIRNIRLGSKVYIRVDAYPWTIFEGEVFAIKGAAAAKFTLVPQNNATGNYTKVEQRVPMKISIKRPKDFPEDKPLYLFPGISAEIIIKVEP